MFTPPNSPITPKERKAHACILYGSASRIRPEAKKTLIQKITSAIDDACHIGDTPILLREYPAETVAMNGGLQSKNPKILEALGKVSAGTYGALAVARQETYQEF